MSKFSVATGLIAPADVRNAVAAAREMREGMTPEEREAWLKAFDGFAGWVIDMLLECVQDVAAAQFTDAVECCKEAAKIEELLT